jgi:hypothetical protein
MYPQLSPAMVPWVYATTQAESGRRFQLTVNMSKMGSGTGVSRTRWYDPTNGAYRIIGTVKDSGSHIFTTPDANSAGAPDWILVLEKN